MTSASAGISSRRARLQIARILNSVAIFFIPGFLVGSGSRIMRFLALYPVPAGRSTARLIYVNIS